MSMTNCPNCGAPKTGPCCEYCGTKFYIADTTVNVDVVKIRSWEGDLVAMVERANKRHA